MRAIIFIILISVSGCNKSNPQKEINNVLDSLHYFASVADQKKYIDLFSKNAGQFFYAQKISKHMNGGALIGKGSFRKFDDYALNIKVKDFSIDKNSKFYNLLFTSRMLDIFSVLQNSQDEFNYLEVPVQKKGKVFNYYCCKKW